MLMGGQDDQDGKLALAWEQAEEINITVAIENVYRDKKYAVLDSYFHSGGSANYMGGGILGGNAKAVLRYSSMYYKVVDEVIKQGHYAGDDQDMSVLTVLADPVGVGSLHL
jgi:hypothetical protein